MSNPFDDLKEEDSDVTEPQDTTESESPTGSEHAGAESSVTDTIDTSTENESDTEQPADREKPDKSSDNFASPAETGPAFEYSEVQQKPFYARTETVSEFENQIRTTIVPKLAEANILDEESREIHDAVLQLANEQPERVAELVLEARRQSGNQ